MRPGIFLPLNTLPGSWHAPVDPAARCASELPCDAGCPANPQRFITPWKPLPMLVPVTSTYCPATKWLARSSVPTGISASGVTRNSASRRLIGTPALS